MIAPGLTVRRVVITCGALTVIALAALALSARAGQAASYVLACSIVVAGIGVGMALARWRSGAGLALVASLPILVFPFAGSLDSGPLEYSNASGALALIASAAALMLALRSDGRHRLLALVWAFLVGAVPVVYGARTAALGVLLLIVTAFLSHRLVRRRGLSGAALLLVCSVIGLTLYLGVTYQEGERTGIAEQVADATLGPLRQQLWQEALELVQGAPLLGVGPDRFAELAPTAQVREDALWAHNEFLQTAAELGIPTAAVLVLVFLVLLWPQPRGALSAPPPMIVAVAMLGTNAALDYVLYDPVVLAAAGLLVGSAVNQPTPDIHAFESAPPPLATALRGRSPAVVALLFLLLLALPLPGLAPDYRRANGVLLDGAGASFATPGELRSEEPPASIYEQLVAGSGFTVEGWFQPYRVDQEGPARLATSSAGIIHRNFTLGQDREALELRLRTTGTDWNARQGRLVVADVFSDTSLRHVAVVYDGEHLSAYVDGRHRVTGPAPPGDFTNWVFTYPLLLGNEDGGERPWLGRVARVGLYDRALSPAALSSLAGQIDLPSGGAAAAEVDGSMVAAYDFRGAGDVVQSIPTGSPLERPPQVEAPAPGFLANLLGVDEGASMNPAALASAITAGVLAVGLGLALARHLQWPRARLTRAIVAGLGAVLLGGTAMYARHRTGVEATIWVLVAAGLGATAGGLLHRPAPATHERPPPEVGRVFDGVYASTPVRQQGAS